MTKPTSLMLVLVVIGLTAAILPSLASASHVGGQGSTKESVTELEDSAIETWVGWIPAAVMSSRLALAIGRHLRGGPSRAPARSSQRSS